MKNFIKAVLAVAVISTPLFAIEPTLETQKHDSSLMMDGMKSLNPKVEATWVSKEQTESVAKESASILKDAKTEIAPAVADAKAALDAQKGGINTTLPDLPEKDSHKAETIAGVAGGAGAGAFAYIILDQIHPGAFSSAELQKAGLFVCGVALVGGVLCYGVVVAGKEIGKFFKSLLGRNK